MSLRVELPVNVMAVFRTEAAKRGLDIGAFVIGLVVGRVKDDNLGVATEDPE